MTGWCCRCHSAARRRWRGGEVCLASKDDATLLLNRAGLPGEPRASCRDALDQVTAFTDPTRTGEVRDTTWGTTTNDGGEPLALFRCGSRHEGRTAEAARRPSSNAHGNGGHATVRPHALRAAPGPAVRSRRRVSLGRRGDGAPTSEEIGPRAQHGWDPDPVDGSCERSGTVTRRPRCTSSARSSRRTPRSQEVASHVPRCHPSNTRTIRPRRRPRP